MTPANSPPPAGSLEKKIITVGELLADPALRIPYYQRPYKWTSKNIKQLFGDLVTHKDKPAYRLGTVVFHADREQKNIVDGQQRTVSLMLTVIALNHLCRDTLKRTDLRAQLDTLSAAMHRPDFSSNISKANVQRNYLEIARIVAGPEFDEEMIDFLLNRCEVVTFTLVDISEAFQFFDSQNARGRDLEPHDLLKAYHLREFDEGDEAVKTRTVARWENSATEELASLFAGCLYRIRQWCRGAPARHFGKDDIGLFKGVNLARVARHPFVAPLRIAHHFVDQYNRRYERDVDGRAMEFPFQLDQIIINGRRFFEMTAHYQERSARLRRDFADPERPGSPALDGHAAPIMRAINNYPGRHRTGDQYVRAIFDCLLLYYLDKFGDAKLSRAIEKIFIWAYSLRLQWLRVEIASMDNHVRDNNLFRLIKDATVPEEFIHCHLPVVPEVRFKKVGDIEALFKEMRYAR